MQKRAVYPTGCLVRHYVNQPKGVQKNNPENVLSKKSYNKLNFDQNKQENMINQKSISQLR